MHHELLLTASVLSTMQVSYGGSTLTSASAQQAEVPLQQNSASTAGSGSAALEHSLGPLPAPFSAPGTKAPSRDLPNGAQQGRGSLDSSGSDTQLSQRDGAAAEAREDDTRDGVAGIAQGLEAARCAKYESDFRAYGLRLEGV